VARASRGPGGTLGLTFELLAVRGVLARRLSFFDSRILRFHSNWMGWCGSRYQAGEKLLPVRVSWKRVGGGVSTAVLKSADRGGARCFRE
jgi:hypothetical protein